MLCSDRIKNILSSHRSVEMELVASLMLKGKELPMDVYAPRINGADTNNHQNLSEAFFGQKESLRLLTEFLEAISSQNDRSMPVRLLLLEGHSGMGKSAFLREAISNVIPRSGFAGHIVHVATVGGGRQLQLCQQILREMFQKLIGLGASVYSLLEVRVRETLLLQGV